ncbi:hypothetical protein, partial [Arthrobacter agilis]|uniref:hypothetical protein n=1 Tax=Arthrobacter agilis TaxID=37921 RepID=UPI0019597B72
VTRAIIRSGLARTATAGACVQCLRSSTSPARRLPCASRLGGTRSSAAGRTDDRPWGGRRRRTAAGGAGAVGVKGQVPDRRV